MRCTRTTISLICIVILTIFGIVWYFYVEPADSPANLPEFFKLSSEEERQSFLTEQACKPMGETPLLTGAVTIPRAEDTPIYQIYCHLQEEQHLPYAAFRGCAATEYTYLLEDCSCAALLVSEDGVLLAAVRYDSMKPEQLLPLLQAEPA